MTDSPSISKEKARRLREGHLRRWPLLASIVVVGVILVAGGAYAFSVTSHGPDSAGSTSSFGSASISHTGTGTHTLGHTSSSTSATSIVTSSSAITTVLSTTSAPQTTSTAPYTTTTSSQTTSSLTSTVSASTSSYTSQVTSTTSTSTQPGSVSVALACDPTSVFSLSNSTCAVQVGAAASAAQVLPTGTVVFGSSSGSFEPPQCSLSSGGCSVEYTSPPASNATTITVTATYTGDRDYTGGAGSASVQVIPRPVSVALKCTPSSLPPTTSTTCTVTVKDGGPGPKVVPTGTVSFQDSASGTFAPSDCSLYSGSCSVSYTAPGVSTPTQVTVTAIYSGDASHGGGIQETSLKVSPRSVSVTAVCGPTPLAPHANATCTVTVQDNGPGTPIVPQGAVSFTSSGGGTFSPSQCTLTSGSCSVTFTAPLVTSPTDVTITATYAGDVVHSGGYYQTAVRVL